MAMAKPRQTKASVGEFDQTKAKLEKRLREFWADETNPVTFTKPNVPALNDLWDDGPELDSKAVQNASPIVEELLGFKLTEKFLKRGGYDSVDDFLADIVPKLRAECEQTPAAPTARSDRPQQAIHPRSKKR